MIKYYRTMDHQIHEISEPMEGTWISLIHPTAAELAKIATDYKIDIAVEHPKYPGCYVAGIECDGNSYYMARTTRDREHLRKSVLEQMGWKMLMNDHQILHRW